MAHEGEIGLRRRTVRLSDHHPSWGKYFRMEKELILRTIGDKVIEIRHIGSTSILGMPAKPIIDIMASVKTLVDVEPFTRHLIAIGYKDRGSGGVVGRRYFVKGEGEEEKKSHHLNFCEMNSFFWRSHLAFRDFLEQNADAAAQYARLKRELANKFPNDREAYTIEKEKFVRSILNLAMKERCP